MTTSAQTSKSKPSITKDEIKQGLKMLLPFSVTKIGESLVEAVITVVAAALTLTWIGTMQPIQVTQSEMTAYIITIFLIIILLRVVHDWDDHYQTNEIGEELATLKEIVNETRLIVKHESTIDEALLDQRLNSIE